MKARQSGTLYRQQHRKPKAAHRPEVDMELMGNRWMIVRMCEEDRRADRAGVEVGGGDGLGTA